MNSEKCDLVYISLIFWDSEKGLREQVEIKLRWTLTLIFAYLLAYLVFPRLNRDLFSSVDNTDTKHFHNVVFVRAFLEFPTPHLFIQTTVYK